MEPLRDTAGNPLPAGANPAIHWNTYLQVRLYFLLSCLGGIHGTPVGHCREPPASRGQPRHPLEHLSPGTVVLLAFLPWRHPWNPCGTLQGTPCQLGPTLPSTGTLISRYGRNLRRFRQIYNNHDIHKTPSLIISPIIIILKT
jgi:hypothetical protein